MAGSYDGGTIYLNVVPSLKGLVTRIAAEAAAAGKASGKAYREAFDAEAGRQGPKVPGPSPQESSREGARSGGAFADAFRKRVEAAARSLPPLRIGAASSEAEQKLRDLRQELDDLSSRTIGVDIDSATALAELDRIRGELAGLNDSTADLQVRADTAAALGEITRVQAAVRDLDGEDAEVEVAADTSRAQAELTSLNGRLLAVVTTAAALSPALLPVGAAGVAALAGVAATAAVGAGAVAALGLGLSGVGDAVGALSEQQRTAGREATASAEAQAAAARGVVAAEIALGKAREDAAAGAERAAQRVTRAQQDLDDARREAAERVTEAEATAARTAEDAAERIASAQREVAQTATRSAREVAAAQQTLARAVSDGERRVSDAREAAADIAERSARTVEDARRRLADVEERASQSVQRALEGVVDAERSLADAQRDALAAQEAVNEARQQAARDAEDLQSSLTRGALDERQAVLDLADANREAADAAALSDPAQLEQAAIRRERAELRLADIQRENARLAAEKAEADRVGVEGSDLVVAAQQRAADAAQAVVDAQAGVAAATAEAARVQQEAAAAVVDAQAALGQAQATAAQANADAQQRVADAQDAAAQRVADAQQRLDEVRVAAGEQALAAQERLTTAQEAAAEAQVRSAERVSDAQQSGVDAVAAAQQGLGDAMAAQAEQQRQATFSVEQAQRSLADAMRSTADTASASAQRVEDAFTGLSPAGAAFATFLFGVKDEFAVIRDAAQEALLPGLMAGIDALRPAIPAIAALVGSLAGALGTLATQAGVALAGPEWRAFFDYLTAEGGPILLALGQAFGTLALAVAQLIVALAPLTDLFVSVLVMGAEAFADLVTQLIGSGFLDQFVAYLIANGPLLLDLFLALVSAFVTITEAMLPFAPLILQIVTGILAFIAAIPPGVLAGLAVGVLAVVTAFQVLGPLLSFLLPIIGALISGAPVLGTVIAALGGPITLIVAAVGALIAILVALYQENEAFRNFVDRAWAAIKDAIRVAWEQVIRPALEALGRFIVDTLIPLAMRLWRDVIVPAFEGISAAVRFAWENIISPALAALRFYIENFVIPIVLFLWRNVVQPAFEGIQVAISVAWAIIQVVLGLLEAYIRLVVIPIITFLWRNVVEPAFDGIALIISTVWEKGIKPVLQALGGFIEEHVAPAFQRGLDAIGAIWETLRDLAKVPVKFVVETVINKGIIAGFNRLAGAVPGLDQIAEVRLPEGFASGGIVPGYTPGRDVHRFYSRSAGVLDLSGGEAILRPEATRALGRRWVDTVNAAARRGGTAGVRTVLGAAGAGAYRAYAGGGILDGLGRAADFAREGVTGALASVGKFVAGKLREALAAVLGPARGFLNGLGSEFVPRLLAGMGNRAIDRLLDFAGSKDVDAPAGDGFTRDGSGWPAPVAGRVATNTFAMIQLVRELAGFTGVAGTLGARPNKSDHPLGKAADFMIPNWSSPVGIALGNKIVATLDAKASDFGLKYWIWRGMIDKGAGAKPYVHPSGVRGNSTLDHFDHVHASVYDSGGFLPPGYSTVFNGTGQPEPVLTAKDFAMLRAAAQGRVRGGDEFHVHGDLEARRGAVRIMQDLQRERDIADAQRFQAVGT